MSGRVGSQRDLPKALAAAVVAALVAFVLWKLTR